MFVTNSVLGDDCAADECSLTKMNVSSVVSSVKDGILILIGRYPLIRLAMVRDAPVKKSGTERDGLDDRYLLRFWVVDSSSCSNEWF